MSLVDYDSSSAEEEGDEELREEGGAKQEEKQERDELSPPLLPPTPHNRLAPSSLQQSNSAHSSSLPSMEKLPDASLLLSSPPFSSYQLIGNDHSRVVPAMAESVSRKRESNGTGFPHPRNKIPRASLPHSRNVPDTVGGLLIPPQLNGRSNVVTEDVNKLFVNKKKP
ncbi:hypothetical protein J5N97_013477 [Dioscorea zingiberensis]|uniref:Uncharacterized protein n=1 Tax=Dioscorea zingiberensis TaxID=325984 RepID=A0A9D5HIU7_9LILI|nr:hypothetical protein J5N97_013477 [Dioscorea zingiberensis]